MNKNSKKKTIAYFVIIASIFSIITVFAFFYFIHKEKQIQKNNFEYTESIPNTLDSQDKVDSSDNVQNHESNKTHLDNTTNNNLPNNEPHYNNFGNLPGNLQTNAYVAEQGEYVFFCNTLGSRLYRSKKDGSELSIVFFFFFIHNEISQLSVVGKYVFFCIYNKNDSKQNGLYKITLDDYKMSIITNDINREYQIYNDWIYYPKYDNELKITTFYKINVSGKEKTKIIELSSRISSFCINESQIFWIQNNQLYSCTHNGNDIKLFSEQPVNGIQAVSNQLYYFYESYEDDISAIGRINIEDRVNEIMISDRYLQLNTVFIATENYLYFDNCCKRINLQTNVVETLFSKESCYFLSEIQCFNITSDYIYYSILYKKSNTALLRVPIKTNISFSTVEALITNTGEWDIYSEKIFQQSFDNSH